MMGRVTASDQPTTIQAVRLEVTCGTGRVEVPAGLDPDSISLELAGSRITVMAHDRAGKLVGSRVVRVRDAVDEEGATVVYERDGSLTIRLRKTPTLR